MVINAIKYEINGRTQYVGLVRMDELVSGYSIDHFQMGEDGKAKGHQRVLSSSRSKKFSNYLSSGKGTFHQTVLANVRDVKKIKFTKSTGNYGTLKITGDVFIVDGQHRVGGLKLLLEKENGYASTLIPINIMIGLPVKSEATEFLIVNKTARGVKADLTDSLIAKIIPEADQELLEQAGISAPKSMLDQLISVTDRLNKTKGNIWNKRIVVQGNPPSKLTVASQRTFTQSLMPVVKDAYISVNFGTEAKLYELLKIYWQAISSICPKATDDEEFRDYVLMKTAGVFVMHRLLPQVAVMCGPKIDVAKIKKVLRKIEEMTDADWHSTGENAGGSSQGFFGRLYKKFSEQL